jgi:sulfane dehydrogenase subunit SoxC
MSVPKGGHVNSIDRARRRFLKEGALLAGMALGAGAVRSARAQSPQYIEKGRLIDPMAVRSPAGGPYVADLRKDIQVNPRDRLAYGERSRYVTTIRTSDGVNSAFNGESNAYTPLQESMGIITPAPLHFVSSHGHFPPDMHPDEYRLMIHGMVDRPLLFTLDDLMHLPSVTRIHFMECSANKTIRGDKTVQETHGKTACSEWTGVPLSLLLKEAGVHDGARWVACEAFSPDKHVMSFPLEKALNDILVAYGQNGEPVRPHQGYPIKLIVPGLEGITHVKWLRRVKVLDAPALSSIPHVTGSGPRLRLMSPKSVITFPSGGHQLRRRGFYEISGLAWSGSGTIRKIEVSTDAGKTWKEAQIKGQALPMAHTRFGFGWVWNGEDTQLLSRCWDDKGQAQPSLADFAKRRGLSLATALDEADEGYQNWKVNSDGSVHNAFVS